MVAGIWGHTASGATTTETNRPNPSPVTHHVCLAFVYCHMRCGNSASFVVEKTGLAKLYPTIYLDASRGGLPGLDPIGSRHWGKLKIGMVAPERVGVVGLKNLLPTSVGGKKRLVAFTRIPQCRRHFFFSAHRVHRICNTVQSTGYSGITTAGGGRRNTSTSHARSRSGTGHGARPVASSAGWVDSTMPTSTQAYFPSKFQKFESGCDAIWNVCGWS